MKISKTSTIIAGLAVVALGILGSPSAHALISVDNAGVPNSITPSGSNWVYTYGITLVAGETISPVTTQFVFTDFAGYVPGTAVYNNNGQAGEVFVATSTPVGPPIAGATPATDSALLPNVLFTYGGVPITAATGGSNVSLGTFSLTSTLGPATVARGREFVFQTTDNIIGLDSGSVNINEPGVPEPSSVAAFAFTGLGLAGLMLRARKSRNMMA